MMKKAFILTAITALLSSNVAFAEDNKVIDLTKEDLSNILRTDSNVVINFYEDDCAECEDLNPVFEDAATNFKGEAKFAKFNCNNEETFCATYGAFGMPKVRAFKNGSPSKLYEDDEPNVDTLLQFMDRQMLPSALEIDSKEELDKLAEEKDLTAVAYISPEDTESLNKWQSMADMLGSVYDFAYVTNPDLAKEQSVTEFPSLAIYKPFDDRLELLSGLPANEVELNRKMTMNSMPVLGAVGEVDLTPYYMTGQPLVFYFYKGQEMRENTDKMVRPLAEKYKGQLHMLHADVKKYGKRAKDFDLPKNAFPAVAAHNLNTDDRYHIDQKKIISAEEVESFIQEVLESEKKSSLQKRAESTIDHANITQITAAEFDKIVLDPKKDVLLEVFSPTCGHCQQFAPTWAQFNDVLKQADSATHDVIAVRMDGLNEMLPASAGFQLAGFPTVKLYKAENNAAGLKNMIDYNGDRSLQDLINFINTQTTKKTFHIDTPEAGSSSRDEL